MFNFGGESSGGGTSSPFVCPNDRQLALRAKLRTGWSQKSASIQNRTHTNQELTDEEQDRILQVLKKAEQFELEEEKRIVNLMQRLQNLHKNVLQMGNSPQQCLLCGEHFGFFHKIQRRSILCQNCGNPVCQKCSISIYNGRNQIYCLICSETREFWMKSGAWFFKSLPNYMRTVPQDSDDLYDEFPLEEVDSKLIVCNNRRVILDVSEPILEEGSEVSPSEQSPNSVPSMEQSTSQVDFSSVPLIPSVSSGKPHYVMDPSGNMGTIELSLHYDLITSTLHCTIYRAKNLIPMDINGLADPFCHLALYPNCGIRTFLRTRTVHKTRNPEFNEKLIFSNLNQLEISLKTLYIRISDDDLFGCDFMGEAVSSLGKLRTRNTLYLTLTLGQLTDVQKLDLRTEIWFKDVDQSSSRGQIQLTLCYSTKKRSLIVHVNQCRHLIAMDSNGQSDPFVKLRLRPDPHHRKYKTSVKWKNLNPVFNEEFSFETRPTELMTQRLFVTVFDKDYGKPNDYLGGLILGANTSKGRRLKHWLDMIRYPDRRHEQWHNLTDDLID